MRQWNNGSNHLFGKFENHFRKGQFVQVLFTFPVAGEMMAESTQIRCQGAWKGKRANGAKTTSEKTHSVPN